MTSDLIAEARRKEKERERLYRDSFYYKEGKKFCRFKNFSRYSTLDRQCNTLWKLIYKKERENHA